MSSTGSRAFYIEEERQTVYAMFDRPRERPHVGAEGGASPSGVLLCPLFGNDDICAYRARRDWARWLASAGHPTLRIDLPSTGDSPGDPYQPDRVAAWTSALAAGARWLREEGGVDRVCAVGMSFGGLLAYLAASQEPCIDDLALWGVPARGRTLLRQLRALAQMDASGSATGSPALATEGEPAVASAGFVLSSDTAAALEAVDLTEIELPTPRGRRVLLLERDGMAVDARLRSALEARGVAVDVAPGPGYGAMVAPPQLSRAPVEVFATVGRWLSTAPTQVEKPERPRPQLSGTAGAARSASRLELDVDGREVRETPWTLPSEQGELLGILAEPAAESPICAILLNAGALRHIGPGRVWVELARRWAAQGVPTLRLDLPGIGDAEGDASALREDQGFYVPSFVTDVRAAMDALVAEGRPQRFVLVGLCSGAYWALHAALADERVAAAYMVNPRALFWDWQISRLHAARNARKLLLSSTWGKLVRGEIRPERLRDTLSGLGVALRGLPTRSSRSRRGIAQLDRALSELQRRGTELLWVFTPEEPLLADVRQDGRLERMRARPNVRVELVPGSLASHTLEPLPLQRAVHASLDASLAALLDAGGLAADGPVRGAAGR